jgi:hypothetical protein
MMLTYILNPGFLDVKTLVMLFLLIITIRTFRRFKDDTLVEVKDVTMEDAVDNVLSADRKNSLSVKSTSNNGEYSNVQCDQEKRTVSTLAQTNETNAIQVAPQSSEIENNDGYDEGLVANKNGATVADRSTSVVSTTNNPSSTSDLTADEDTNEGWRCVCETGFLPPGLLKSFGGMEAMVRMSTGQCYHKTA